MTRLHRAGLVAVLAVPALLFLLLQVNVAPMPAPEQVFLFEAETARAAGQPAQAAYLLEVEAAEQGWTAEKAWAVGDLWLQMGDQTRAVSYWQLAMTVAPEDTRGLRAVAQALTALGRWAEATDVLERLAGVEDDPWAHLELGMIRAAFDPQRALVHLESAAREPAYAEAAQPLIDILTEYNDDPLVSMRAGLALAEQGQWPYAELAFAHAATVGEPFAEALAYTGLARDQQGKDGGAWFERAVALDPHNAQVRFLEGLHYRLTGDNLASLNALVQAVALDPENPALYAELGQAYRRLRDLPSADYWLRMAVLVSGEDARFQELLALFYAEEAPSLTDQGVQALEATVSLLPEDPDVQAGFGWALFQMGRTEEAAAQLDAVLAEAPTNARALYYRARLFVDAGETIEAAPLLSEVANGDSPFAAEAARVLATLGVTAAGSR